MKEVIPHRIVTDEKEIVYEKTTASKFNHFVVNIEPKLASKIPASNTHFEQYVKYEGLILERIAFCDEELKNALSSLKSNKSPGHDGISSNLIKCVSEKLFDVLKHVLNFSIHQGVFPENMKITRVAPIFKSGGGYLLPKYRPFSVLPCFSKS